MQCLGAELAESRWISRCRPWGSVLLEYRGQALEARLVDSKCELELAELAPRIELAHTRGTGFAGERRADHCDEILLHPFREGRIEPPGAQLALDQSRCRFPTELGKIGLLQNRMQQ